MRILLSIAGIALTLLGTLPAVSAEEYMNLIPLIPAEGESFPQNTMLRLSLWDDGKLRPQDITNGTINENAKGYGGFQTEITLSPNADGAIALQPPSLEGLPDVTPANFFMMVEYKDASSPDSAYVLYKDELLGDTPMNRFPLLDTAEALLKVSYENEGSGMADDVSSLTFGEDLNSTLSFDDAGDRFVLTNDLRLEGNIGVIGNAYIAQDHAADESSGILFFGRSAGEWATIQWDLLLSGFRFSAPVILPHLADCSRLATDENGTIICGAGKK